MPEWTTIASKIAAVTGRDLTRFQSRPVGGGCINNATILSAGKLSYFVKHNASARLDMFIAEAEGLCALAATETVRVPTPICWGIAGDAAFLVLEYLALAGAGPAAQSELGQQLARMHRTVGAQYGWHRDNTIGATLQRNTGGQNWIDFFRDQRLGFQLELAGEGGYSRLRARGERLLSALEKFFEHYVPAPSLLHGDLWGGNVGQTGNGAPVVYDPAVYFGDRETDMAMTELFGGFSESFYRSYEDAWPLDTGYKMRRTLYNLYHVLNHLNLFGGGYLAQVEQMIDRLLAEVR